MDINQFVKTNRLQPADAIMLNKKIFGMLDHYVIYLGVHNNRHIFVANYTKGVRVLQPSEMRSFLQVLIPRQIYRFTGSRIERQQAVQRAVNRVGEKAYSYLENNCEHFMNYVQNGVSKSLQSDNFKKGAVTAVAIGAGIGILAALLGGGDKK